MPLSNNIAATSFWPGLQNIGQTSGTAQISGTLNGSPSGVSSTSSNMTGTIFIPLPDSASMSLFRLNFPNGSGDLASNWFPLMGSLQLWDTNYKLILTIGNAAGGKNIYFNFVNTSTSVLTFNNYQVNIVGHLYTYPF